MRLGAHVTLYSVSLLASLTLYALACCSRFRAFLHTSLTLFPALFFCLSTTRATASYSHYALSSSANRSSPRLVHLLGQHEAPLYGKTSSYSAVLKVFAVPLRSILHTVLSRDILARPTLVSRSAAESAHRPFSPSAPRYHALAVSTSHLPGKVAQ